MRGRSIAGHSRFIGREGSQWFVACKCGWREPAKTFTQAKMMYTVHRATATPICKCGVQLTHEIAAIASPHSCKSCVTKKTRAYKARAPERWDQSVRRSHISRKYGITPEMADEIFASQGGLCAICSEPIIDVRGYRPHIDHCHRTGNVRGILCGRCNRGIGMFGDDAERMRAAAAYLDAAERAFCQ